MYLAEKIKEVISRWENLIIAATGKCTIPYAVNAEHHARFLSNQQPANPYTVGNVLGRKNQDTD
jgi:hypothetical protein